MTEADKNETLLALIKELEEEIRKALNTINHCDYKDIDSIKYLLGRCKYKIQNTLEQFIESDIGEI